ncbi:MAG: copper chaperone PCu(A)C [Gammaproteobacteria bacterium]|nr:copper chaperone PCu(A)C [Gammaproteobacteria bacterium]MDH3468506.1 copper chaperone PCu(A)C [Gammaproteobacteria bacterium]
MAAPPTAHAFAGYMTIDSIGTEPARIVGVTSPAFSRIEIHESRQEDGMMRMRALPELRIAGGERLVLQPGAVHLMLMDPKASLRLGDTVTVRVMIDGGESIDVLLTVRLDPNS